MNQSAIISLVHVFITGLFLFYVGWVNVNLVNWLYWVLLVLGIAILLVWLPKLSWSLMPIVHIFVVAPVLIYLGWFKNKSPYWLYQMCTIIGSAAIGYHGMKLVKNY